MRMRFLLIPIVLALGSPVAFGQYLHTNPNERTITQPELVLARIDGEGQLVIKRLYPKPNYKKVTVTVTEMREETESRLRKETRNQDGKQIFVDVPYTVLVKRPVERQVEKIVSMLGAGEQQLVYSYNFISKQYQAEEGGQSALFFETDGKSVPAEDLASRLTTWQPMVASFSQQTVADYYTKIFKPGTLVAALPRPMAPPPPPDSPPPPIQPMPLPMPPDQSPQPPANAEQPMNSLPVVFQPEENGEENEDGELPTTLPPTFAFARVTNSELDVRTITEVTKKRTVPDRNARAIAPEGEVPTVPPPLEMLHVVRTDHIWKLAVSSVEASTATGQILETADLRTKLARETTVLITREGQKADAFWLKNLKPDTLILSTSIPGDSIFQVCEPQIGGAYAPPVMMPPKTGAGPTEKPSA